MKKYKRPLLREPSVLGGIVVILLTAATIVYDNSRPPKICELKLKVMEITQVEYRTATVKLENGELLKLDQPTVKPGDVVCVK